jgi:hypothetical protein
MKTEKRKQKINIQKKNVALHGLVETALLLKSLIKQADKQIFKFAFLQKNRKKPGVCLQLDAI